MKVLLVDDDAFLRDMYATKFIESSHEVDAASNAAEALSKLKEKDYDAVMLDMIMPGMSGLDVLAEVKKLSLAPKTKFIILSNQSESVDQSAAKESGAVGYIIKAESIPSEVVKQVEGMCK
jgi:DNA-binding response OmpR family regulator